MRWRLLLAVAFLASLPAAATTYYVDASATGCSGAPCSDSNNGTAEATAWLTVNKCITKPLVAGDTCLIKNGSYPRGSSAANLTPVYDLCGLHGASGNPITFAAYPGHAPIICVNNGAGACTSAGTVFGSNENCSSGGWSYTTVRGLYFQGLVFIHGGVGIVITGNDIKGGGAYNDGNCATIRADVSPGTQIDHNYIHAYNTAICPGESGDHSNQYITFESPNTIIEYNTFDTSDGSSRSQSIQLKSGSDGHIVRYNDLMNGNLLLSYQKNGSTTSGSVTGLQIYGNVIRQGYIRARNLDVGTLIYNNTFLGGGFNWNSDGKASLTSSVYNNIIQNPGNGLDCSPGNCNTNIANWSGAAGAWANRSGYVWDYNAYRSGANFFSVGGGFSASTSIASWRTAFGKDANSFVGSAGTSGGPCTFLAGSDTPYHITSATVCKTGACTNWPTCSTTTTEFGAYGVTSCVGYTCGTSVPPPDTTPPVRSGGSPSGTVAAGTTSTALGVVTDEAATCRYSTTSGVAYASMTNTFSTTGGTTHATTVTGLANGTSYTYYVRCQDVVGNPDTTDYSISFSISTPGITGPECVNWAAAHPTWLWCDDFEDDSLLETNYFSVGRAGGNFGVTTDQFYLGSHSIRFHYTTTQQDAGGVWRNFGTNPIGTQSNDGTNYTDIYWRFFVRHQSPWTNSSTDGDDKMTRATMFVGSGYTQGMIAHLWNGQTQNLHQSPVRLISGTTVLSTTYNDFAHMIYEGDSETSGTITSSSDVGNWHCIEERVKLNTAGVADGIQQTWVDGVLVDSDTTINFRDSYTTHGINTIMLEGYWNGNAPVAQNKWIDNFVIATAPIGCAVAVTPSAATARRRTVRMGP